MRYDLYIIPVAFLLVLISCSGSRQEDRSMIDSVAKAQPGDLSSSVPKKPKYNFTDPGFILDDHRHKFYTGTIRKFDHEFLKQLGKMGNYFDSLYPVLDRESFDVFQSNEMVVDAFHEGTPYYYAIQHTGYHTGIIILRMNDNWINEYIYLAYNPQGKLVGSAVLAGEGGDGGYVTTMTGEFINDSVFIKKTIETEHDPVKEVNNVIVNTTDEITVHYNGKIETRTLKK